MSVRRRFGVVAVAALILSGIGAWAAFDFRKPQATSLREFDPDDVARLETRMWRSYYDRERLSLFNEMAALLRHQYRMPLLRSYIVGFHAAKAAFVFKDGTQRSEYERALPDLVDYYTAIRRVTDTPFNIDKAAHLELEWWIVHRQRHLRPSADLDNALADLAAEIYQMSADRFREHARYRGDAMIMRDDLAEHGGVTEADWQKIDELLHHSWRSLWNAVNARSAQEAP